MTITDPMLEFHVFYLRRAVGDDEAAKHQRYISFVTELQQTATTLRSWLGLPDEQISWKNAPLPNRRTMVQQYYSGKWQDLGNRYHVWLMAYEMNDTFLLRAAVSRIGADQSPQAVQDLQEAFLWRPNTDLPEFLGEQQYAICLSSGLPKEMAQAILNAPAVQHTVLTCGELFSHPTVSDFYLLIYPNLAQEALLASFFDEIATQFGWFRCKVARQERLYTKYLHPAVDAAKQQLMGLLQKMQNRPSEELSQLVQELAQAMDVYDDLLATVRIIKEVVGINIDNFKEITQPSMYLHPSAHNELFPMQVQRLQQASQQIAADLDRWEITRNRAQAQWERYQSQRTSTLTRKTNAFATLPSPLAEPDDFLFLEADVTIMVNQIADSTAIIQAYGDRQWQQLMAQHDALVQQFVGHFNGRVMNRLGNGRLCIFADAGRAVQAAQALQTAVAQQNQSAAVQMQLPLRIGLHSGKALVGRDRVLGLAVNMAIEVCETAVSHSIVISAATYELLGEETAVCVPIGPQTLKGFTGAVYLYRLDP